MKRSAVCVFRASLVVFGSSLMLAQSLEPANMLRIIREEIKPGRSAAHERVETGYVRAFSHSKYPNYVALESVSGPSEAWFLEQYDAYADLESAIQVAAAEPLKSALDQLDAQDGEQRTGGRNLICTYHKELSYLPVPSNLPGMRYMSISMVRVRPGRIAEFAEMRKLVNAAFEKSGSKQRRVVYAVTSGAPTGTCLILSGMESLKAMDSTPSMSMADAFGPENMEHYRKLQAEIVLSTESTLFAANPRMSYPPKEYITAAPDFWAPKPKTAAAKPAAPKAAEPKAAGGQ